jgi:hypothetical protein
MGCRMCEINFFGRRLRFQAIGRGTIANRGFGFRPSIVRLPLVLLLVLVLCELSCHPPSERLVYDEYRIVHVDIESFKNLDVYRLESQDNESFVVFNLKCDTLNMPFQKGQYEKIKIGKLYRLNLVQWSKKPEPNFAFTVQHMGEWGGGFVYYQQSEEFNLQNDSLVDAVVRGFSDLPVIRDHR